jgi:hypothetical protein
MSNSPRDGNEHKNNFITESDMLSILMKPSFINYNNYGNVLELLKKDKNGYVLAAINQLKAADIAPTTALYSAIVSFYHVIKRKDNLLSVKTRIERAKADFYMLDDFIKRVNTGNNIIASPQQIIGFIEARNELCEHILYYTSKSGTYFFNRKNSNKILFLRVLRDIIYTIEKMSSLIGIEQEKTVEGLIQSNCIMRSADITNRRYPRTNHEPFRLIASAALDTEISAQIVKEAFRNSVPRGSGVSKRISSDSKHTQKKH